MTGNDEQRTYWQQIELSQKPVIYRSKEKRGSWDINFWQYVRLYATLVDLFCGP